MGSELVKPHHLNRRAVIYVRQSTAHQVLTNQESLRLHGSGRVWRTGTDRPPAAGQGRPSRPAATRSLGRWLRQPRAQEGAAALPDRQGGAAPERA